MPVPFPVRGTACSEKAAPSPLRLVRLAFKFVSSCRPSIPVTTANVYRYLAPCRTSAARWATLRPKVLTSNLNLTGPSPSIRRLAPAQYGCLRAIPVSSYLFPSLPDFHVTVDHTTLRFLAFPWFTGIVPYAYPTSLPLVSLSLIPHAPNSLFLSSPGLSDTLRVISRLLDGRS